jgi:hypothetical protein
MSGAKHLLLEIPSDGKRVGRQGDLVRLPILYSVGIELATKAMPASRASMMLVQRRDVDRDGQV